MSKERELKDFSIADSFDSYRATVMPADVPPVGVNQARTLFFSGAFATLLMVRYSLTSDMSKEERHAAIDQLLNEADEYIDQLVTESVIEGLGLSGKTVH